METQLVPENIIENPIQPIQPVKEINNLQNTSDQPSNEEINNLQNVKYVVSRSENPNPMTIIIIIVIVILLIYFIYKKFIKQSFSGIWVDENNIKHIILHDKYTDEIMIDNQYYGNIKYNIITFYVDDMIHMGIIIKDEINWSRGSSWNQILGY
jgi:hypothetical protein